MINVHAEGELGYVVTEGLPELPGQTIADRLAALNAGDGMLRRHLMLAPRANPACSVNLLMPPVDRAPTPLSSFSSPTGPMPAAGPTASA